MSLNFKKFKIKAKRRESQVLSTTNLRAFKSKTDGSKMINHYKIIKTLGKGGYATVKLCEDSNTNDFYAMKQMNKKELKKKMVGKEQNAYMYVIEELKVLQRLQHPNIIYLHEIIDDPKKDFIYLITQYHSKGSLADQLENVNRHYESRNEQCLSDGRP
mgnify:CR=1 FL=1